MNSLSQKAGKTKFQHSQSLHFLAYSKPVDVFLFTLHN